MGYCDGEDAMKALKRVRHLDTVWVGTHRTLGAGPMIKRYYVVSNFLRHNAQNENTVNGYVVYHSSSLLFSKAKDQSAYHVYLGKSFALECQICWTIRWHLQ